MPGDPHQCRMNAVRCLRLAKRAWRADVRQGLAAINSASLRGLQAASYEHTRYCRSQVQIGSQRLLGPVRLCPDRRWLRQKVTSAFIRRYSLEMKSRTIIPTLVLLVQFMEVPFYGSSSAKSKAIDQEVTCAGEFERGADGSYGIGGRPTLSAANARKVMKICSLGQQCEVTGTIEHCKGVRGACGEFTNISRIRWGKPLPLCAENAAVVRADQWWSQNVAVMLREG